MFHTQPCQLENTFHLTKQNAGGKEGKLQSIYNPPDGMKTRNLLCKLLKGVFYVLILTQQENFSLGFVLLLPVFFPARWAKKEMKVLNRKKLDTIEKENSNSLYRYRLVWWMGRDCSDQSKHRSFHPEKPHPPPFSVSPPPSLLPTPLSLPASASFFFPPIICLRCWFPDVCSNV